MIVNMFGTGYSSWRDINFSITDPHGGVYNGSFKVTIQGTNDRPELTLDSNNDRITIVEKTTNDGKTVTEEAQIKIDESEGSFTGNARVRTWTLARS